MELPHSLVTCDSLEVLRLYLCECPLDLPTVTGIPALNVLELNSIRLPDHDSIQHFIKGCPLLEDLSLIDCLFPSLYDLYISCPNLKTLKIDNQKTLEASYNARDLALYVNDCLCNHLNICCPKLMFLEYAGHRGCDFSFANLDSLKKAVIYPDTMPRVGLSFESFGDTISQLFARVSHVESLSLNLFFIQAISAASDANGDFPASLPNLKTLEISTTIDDYTMSVIMRILKCSPNLESFHLVIQEETFGPEVWKLDEELTRHLKRVEFLEFSGEKQKLDMARFLLENGNELEEMVFSWRGKLNYHEKSTETMKEMLKFDKASSAVKLITLLKD